MGSPRPGMPGQLEGDGTEGRGRGQLELELLVMPAGIDCDAHYTSLNVFGLRLAILFILARCELSGQVLTSSRR